jgi:hypothetical protein
MNVVEIKDKIKKAKLEYEKLIKESSNQDSANFLTNLFKRKNKIENIDEKNNKKQNDSAEENVVSNFQHLFVK